MWPRMIIYICIYLSPQIYQLVIKYKASALASYLKDILSVVCLIFLFVGDDGGPDPRLCYYLYY